MSLEQTEIVRSLTELLVIAKVAMPGPAFDNDPRVQRARQLLIRVGRGTLDMSSAEPQWDITAGLDTFMASEQAPSTRTEAVVLILREWLTGNGYLGLPPEDAN